MQGPRRRTYILQAWPGQLSVSSAAGIIADIFTAPGDPSFSQLKDALAAQDWELAFRASHTLKGVAQNLGMDRLYKTAATLCDAVRGPKPLEDASLWPPVVAAHEEVLAAIREL